VASTPQTSGQVATGQVSEPPLPPDAPAPGGSAQAELGRTIPAGASLRRVPDAFQLPVMPMSQRDSWSGR